eukprot:g13879.t1
MSTELYVIKAAVMSEQEIKVILDDLILEVIRGEESPEIYVESPTEDIMLELFGGKKRIRSDSMDTAPPDTPKRLRISAPQNSPEWEHRLRTSGGWIVTHGKDYPGSPYLRFEEDSEDEMSCSDSCSCQYNNTDVHFDMKDI